MINYSEYEPDPFDSDDDIQIDGLENSPAQTDFSFFSDEKLIDLVVAARYLSIYQSMAALAMEELVKRRETGSMFMYEEEIAKKTKQLPIIPAQQKSFLKMIK